MNKICLIGNSGTVHQYKDGQTSKVRLYRKKMTDEGFDVTFVDLELFTKKPLKIFCDIKKGIVSCDRVILITAKRGSRVLLPYINWINKKYNKPIIFPLIGSSVLHYSIDNLSDDEICKFFTNRSFENYKKPRWISDNLKKMKYILTETDFFTNIYRNFYKLDNCFTLTNFREDEIINISKANHSKAFRIVFISRVMELKGIFDLLEVIVKINKKSKNVQLDIYGDKFFNKDEEERFDRLLNDSKSSYYGPVNNENVIKIISKYDLLVFPTRAPVEGTPGIIVESLLAETPILTSNFPNADCLLRNGFDSIFYEMYNKNDLEAKLVKIINNKFILKSMKDNIKQSSNKYKYSYNRDLFLKYVCGVDDDN